MHTFHAVGGECFTTSLKMRGMIFASKVEMTPSITGIVMTKGQVGNASTTPVAK